MGHAWGWVPNDNYKSSKELVHLLVGIVAKGGNLLLGVGPKGNGEFEPAVYKNLAQLGEWLEVHGEAIYDTQPVEPYQVGQIAYTANGDVHYAIYMPGKDEQTLPASLMIDVRGKPKPKFSLLGVNMRLKAKRKDAGWEVQVPKKIRHQLADTEAIVVKVTF